MSDCLTYLTVGSNETNPEDTCCTGLKTVLDTDANCLCEGLKSSASLGFNIDFKKAKAIPSVCKIPTPPSLTGCDLTSSPSTPGAPSSPGKVQVALVWNSRDENSPSSKKLNALANFLWRYGGPNRKVHLIHSVWANFQTSINNEHRQKIWCH